MVICTALLGLSELNAVEKVVVICPGFLTSCVSCVVNWASSGRLRFTSRKSTVSPATSPGSPSVQVTITTPVYSSLSPVVSLWESTASSKLKSVVSTTSTVSSASRMKSLSANAASCSELPAVRYSTRPGLPGQALTEVTRTGPSSPKTNSFGASVPVPSASS